jgi:hypothetical protein
MPQTPTSPDAADRQAILIDVLATALLDLLASPSPHPRQIQQTSRPQRKGSSWKVSIC